MKARFKVFPSVFKSWEETCEKVAAFVEKVGPERLISISHTAEPVAIVWYWEPERTERDAHGRDRG
ncbi:MAG TPA: hypothetical protein VFB66_02840 [Tepidisphaeraceae bacterium]|nr:hypothetical protein [Tepidisphaeraceae bacterium]